MSNQIKVDIIELALEETKEYIAKLPIQQVLSTQLKKHVDLHNSGTPIVFNYGALDYHAAFNHFVLAFGLDPKIVQSVPPERFKNIFLKGQSKEATYDFEINSLRREIKKVNVAKDSRGFIEGNLPEEFANSERYLNLKAGIEDLFLSERAILENKVETLKRQIELSKKLRKNVRNLSDVFKDYEKMFMKMVQKFYFSRLKFYFEDMFKDTKVVFRYKDYEWDKDYGDKAFRDEIQNLDFTRFQKKLFSWIDRNKIRFRLELERNDNSAYIANGSYGLYDWHKKNRVIEEGSVAEANQNLNAFFQKHPAFYVAVKTANIAKAQIGDQSVTYRSLIQSIIESCANIIDEYNELVNAVTVAQQANIKKENPKPTKIEEVFPELKINLVEVENYLHGIAGIKDKTNIVLQSFETDSYVVPMHHSYGKIEPIK